MSSHLKKLSRSVHAFFTPGQLLSTTRDVLSALQKLWEGFSDAYKIGLSHSGVGARKKRRKSAPKEEVASTSLNVDSWAIRFAHAARVVSSVISALPVHLVTDEGQEEIRHTVRSAMEGFVSEAIHTSLEQVGRAEEDRARADGDEWAAQVVGTAALRLRYAVEAAGDFGDIAFEKAEEGMVAVVSNENALPEYRIEIVRARPRSLSFRADCARHYTVPYPIQAIGLSWFHASSNRDQRRSDISREIFCEPCIIEPCYMGWPILPVGLRRPRQRNGCSRSTATGVGQVVIRHRVCRQAWQYECVERLTIAC